jgi:preprotein translocase subunit SecD
MKFNLKATFFAASLIFGIAFSIPSFFGTSGAKITLGLDLQGGLHMLLGVKSEKAVESRVKSLASSVRYHADHNRIILASLESEIDRVVFTLIDEDDLGSVQEFLKEYEGLEVSSNRLTFSLALSPVEQEKIKKQAIEQAVETIRNRLNQLGLAEPIVAKQGEDAILVELPGIKTQEEEQRARQLIAKTAHLRLMAVDEDRNDIVHTMTPLQARQYGDVIYPDLANANRKYLLKEIEILDGGKLTNAEVAFDPDTSLPVINFALNSEGATIFGDFTARNVNKRMAIVLDDVVYSAPSIRERIGGGHVQVSGDFTITEANDIAIALRSGALLAPVYLLEKRSVGPSLGADSIKAAMLALIGGFILVVIFMFIYYKMAGLIANLALIANLFIIIAVMAMLGATLTLPGMAGIVLTVGMAVDANVIISERIRELLAAGNSVKKSIEDGYNNAMRAILDANITTLIASVVLYVYGTGPIKGFAITISIGIIASMLTAIIGTHGVYELLGDKIAKAKNNRFWFGVKDQ